MKQRRKLIKLTPLVAILLPLGGNLSAQEIDEDVVELSPFVVSASEDVGYLATTTLAGSRIRSDIKDIGLSLAIVTQEFMDDTGATDGESVLQYVANMEVGGALGNFANPAGNDITNTESSRLNPQSSQRVRGLAAAATMRDYFRTDLPFDSYNTSRLEVNRGPNSILFGLGSPGGVINASTQQAIHNNNSGQFSFRFDMNGGHREEFNFNRSLIKDRLAVRMALLNEDVKFNQKPAYEDDNRFYIAADAVLLENKKSSILGKTSVRGSYEYVSIRRNPPDVIPPTDHFSSFFDGVGSQEDLNRLLSTPGVSLADIPNNGVTASQVLSAINSGLVEVPEGMTPEEYAAIEGQFIPKTLVNRFSRGGSVDPTNGGRNQIPNINLIWIFPAINFNSPTATQAGWDDPNLAGIHGIMQRWRPNGFPTQDMAWTQAVTGGAGFNAKSIMDRNIFDYHNKLFQGNSNYVDTKYDLKQFILTQDLLDGVNGFDAGVEVAYDHQKRRREDFMPFSGGNPKAVRIDLATHHPQGDSNATPGVRDGIPDSYPNENVARPVTYWNYNLTRWSTNEAETFRFTGYLTADMRDLLNNNLGKWLGSHTVTGLYESRETNNWNKQTQPAWWADNSKWPGSPDISNGLSDNFRRIVKSQIYLGPDVSGLTSASDVRLDGYLKVPFPKIGDTYRIWYFDNNNSIDMGQIADWRLIENIQGANVSKQELDSKAFSLQSKLLHDHLVFTWAIRKDRQKSYQRIQENTTYGDPSVEGVIPLRIDLPGINEIDGSFNMDLLHLLPDPTSIDEGTTETLSIVGHVPEIGFEFPFGADLSFHYYRGESFEPAGISVNILNEPLASPSGETDEYGATLSLFDNRLSIRFSKFETTNANDRTNLGGALPQILGNNSIEFYLERIASVENDGTVGLFPSDEDAALTPDTIPSNRERLTGTDADLGGFNSFDEYYAALLAAVPPEAQAVYNYRMDTTESGVVYLESNPVPGVNSTQDYVAKGFELDIAGQLTRNLFISANIAKQETVLSNIGPVAIPLAYEVLENLQEPLAGSPGNWALWDLRDSPFQREKGTIGTRYSGVMRTIRIQQGMEGQVSSEQRKWRANLTLRYDMQDYIEGLQIGGSLRYEDEVAVGYPNMEIITDEGDSLILPDVNNPYMGDDALYGDLFIRYRKKFDNGIDWSIQFNARNLYRSNGSDDTPVYINPDGTTAVVRIPVEQQFFITNTFYF